VVEGDVAPDAVDLDRVGRVVDLDGHLHDLDEPLDAGDAAHDLLGELDQPPDRHEQRLREQDVGDVVRGGDAVAAGDQKQRAEHDDHDEHQPVEQPRDRVKARHVAVHVPLDPQKPVVALGELLLFEVLVRKRLYDAYPRQAVLDLRVQLAQLVARLLEGLAHLAGEFPREVDHEREDRKDDERQRHVDRQEDSERRDDLDRGDEYLLRRVVRKLRDLEQVRRDPRHDLPDLRVVVERVRQPLQVREHVAPHVGLDVRAHHVADRLHVVVRRGVDEPEHDVEPAQEQHRAHRQAPRGAGEIPDDQRKRQVAQRRQRREEQVQREYAPVGLEVGVELLEKLGVCLPAVPRPRLVVCHLRIPPELLTPISNVRGGRENPLTLCPASVRHKLYYINRLKCQVKMPCLTTGAAASTMGNG